MKRITNWPVFFFLERLVYYREEETACLFSSKVVSLILYFPKIPKKAWWSETGKDWKVQGNISKISKTCVLLTGLFWKTQNIKSASLLISVSHPIWSSPKDMSCCFICENKDLSCILMTWWCHGSTLIHSKTVIDVLISVWCISKISFTLFLIYSLPINKKPDFSAIRDANSGDKDHINSRNLFFSFHKWFLPLLRSQCFFCFIPFRNQLIFRLHIVHSNVM